MRGLWALGEGVRVFDAIDLTMRIASEAYLRTEAALARRWQHGETYSVHGFEVPAWIPAVSLGLLRRAARLAASYEARPNETTADITKIADGVAQYRW